MADPTDPIDAGSQGEASSNNPPEADEDALFAAEVRSMRRKLLMGGLAAATLGVAGCWGVCIGYPCLPIYWSHGAWMDQCPTSDLRLEVRLEGSRLRRGAEGSVTVSTIARYYDDEGPYAPLRRIGLLRGVDLDLALKDDRGEVVTEASFTRADSVGGQARFEVQLPADLVDGDYTLSVRATAPFDTAEAVADLPLYSPALVHVASDRPLYKPGQEVKLRAVLLRRTDLTPLDQRSGRWAVTSPSGEVMLIEKDRAGAYGIADTTFPLDGRAEEGTWYAAFESGDTRDQVSFDVRPFQLPRFTVEVEPAARWFGVGDELSFSGTARYTSGAPVANASVAVALHAAEGRWPMPLEWEALPDVRTDAFGRFEIAVGEVPADLLERSVIQLTARVTEEAGTVLVGSSRAVLSVDDLMTEVVTELGDGLVGGFNNRAYLRVMTPDGRPIPGASVEVWPAHDDAAKRREDVADEDGVAAIQLDPGDPVTVVIPAAPVRERPFTPELPSIRQATLVASSTSLSMAERRSLDRLVPRLAKCGDYALGGLAVRVGLRVSPSGGVSRVMHGPSRLDQCVGDAMRTVRMPSGGERTYAITWEIPDTQRPSLTPTVSVAFGEPSAVQSALAKAIVEARSCMPVGAGMSGSRMLEAHWTVTEGSRLVESRVVPRPAGSGLTPAQVGCVGATVARMRLDEPARADAMGALQLVLNTPRRPGASTPRPMTKTAYELAVAASVDGSEIGATRLIVDPGQVPAVRLRATPSLAAPGDEILVEILRGPDFRGTLPEKATLMQGSAAVVETEVDRDTRQLRFTLPDDASGFYHLDLLGARAVLFARRPDPLSVAVTTDKATYRPGEEAMLTVTTLAGTAPTQAAVGLSGVDQTLGELEPLLKPDDWGRITVRATSDRPAFGSFDPRALTLGQVRGDNAAKASLLRISSLPTDFAGDVVVGASGQTVPDEVEVLTTHFYRALVDLHRRVAAWEAEAAQDALLTNAELAELWGETLRGLLAAGEPAVDAYGRTLTLAMLPDDLLDQCDPRQVVSDATHLPEDIEDWTTWVRRGQP